MLRLFRAFSLCAVALVLAAPSFAADEKPAEKKAAGQAARKAEKQAAAKGEQGAKKGPANAAFQAPKGIELSEEQQAEVGKLKKQYAAKLKEAVAGAKLTKEQAASRKEALAKAKAEGLKGKKLQYAADSAVTFTEEQQKARNALASLRKEIQASIRSLLTEEQKAKLPGKKKAKKAE
ncbi:MAG: hypothetical protein WD875_11620 [Pirellulales bacterium]